MRYESFYPFARNSAPIPRQQNFGLNPYSAPPQNPGQPHPFSMQNNQLGRGQPGMGNLGFGPQGLRQAGPMQAGPGQQGLGQQGLSQQGLGQAQGTPQGLSKMDGYMQTANRFLNTAQQYAPVVQQFAPMMRNLPAMWKLYKGFQAMPPVGDAPSTATAATAGLSNPRIQASSAPVPSRAPIPSPPSSRPSVPRIFQPSDF